MGVYIKGMEMPSSCYKCHLRQRNGMDIVCPVAHERFSVADVNILDFRLTNCPLVPVPPHGDLIERDAVKEKRHWTDDLYEIEYVEVEDIDDIPTIIPASE